MKTMWMWMGAGIALCMSACGESPPAAVDGHAGAPSVDGMEAGAVTAPATPFVRATAALADNRMLSPAGDNAVEHYIAARTEASEQVRAQAALAELQPYVLIAAEQAIARGDAAEAARLQGLIERIDAQAPALPRLRTAVATLLREQVIQAAAAVDAPPAPVAATAPTRTTASPTITPAATTAATVPSEPAPAAVSPPAPTVLAQEQPAPSAVPAAVPRTVQAARAPRLLQDAQPRYPLPALRARIEGQAEVAFIIQPDGSVRDVRLLSSTPAGMFDASALAVAQRWRFEATGQAHASSRTVRFRLPAEESRGG
jgi:protein TonB